MKGGSELSTTTNPPAWATPAAVLEDGRLAVWPAAPGAEDRVWARSDAGTFAGPPLALIDELVDEALPAWNRSLRVALGRAEGLIDEAEANRRGRSLLQEQGVRLQEARSEVEDLAAEFWNDPVRDLLRAAGEIAPRLGVYNVAAEHADVCALLLPRPGSNGPASRNIALLGLRIAREEEWEHAGALVGAVRRFIAADSWPAQQAKIAWKFLLRLPPDTALQLDASQAALLPLLPNGDPKLIVERLTSDVLRSAAGLCTNYSHRNASRVAGLLVTEACRERVDHGDLLQESEQLQQWVAEFGWEALGELPRTWGRLYRNLSRRARDEQDRIEAEAQAAEALARERRWLERVEPYHDGAYEVVELTDAVELADEGAAMRHCVGTYASRCLSGNTRIFSIRKDEKRIATARVEKQNEAWKLQELRCYKNGPTTRELEDVGKRLAKRYSTAAGATLNQGGNDERRP